MLLLVALVLLLGAGSTLLWAQSADNLQDVIFQQALVAGAIVTLIAVALSMWLAARFIDRRRFADFGFHMNQSWWADLGFGLLLGALLMAAIFLLQWAAGWVTVVGTFQTAIPGQPFALALLQPIVLFLCIGIYEEMLARGYLLLNLSEGLNLRSIGPRGAVLLAWLLSSAIFGLGHAINPNATFLSTANLVLAGLLLGLGYVLTGQLALPIGLHITWNLFQGTVFGFPVSGLHLSQATLIAIEQRGPDLLTGGAFGPEGGLLGTAGTLLSAMLLLLWVRRRRGDAAIQVALAEPPPWPRDHFH